ncbi:winged helix-turn-helix domain-containing protein [Streptomyces sp. NPDC057889]|uniref:winged helix-turn-helix domain-containing protein n=1 Tax=unclassified Streptomyces TaxID=2593676 RepID=UPI0036A4D662
MDPASRRVWRGETEVQLSPKGFALLELFVRHPGDVPTRTRILEHVWDFPCDGVSNVVDQYVAYLRRKVDGPDEHSHLETVCGAGYQLRAPAGVVPPTGPCADAAQPDRIPPPRRGGGPRCCASAVRRAGTGSEWSPAPASGAFAATTTDGEYWPWLRSGVCGHARAATGGPGPRGPGLDGVCRDGAGFGAARHTEPVGRLGRRGAGWSVSPCPSGERSVPFPAAQETSAGSSGRCRRS